MSATAKPQEVERFTLSKGQVALTKDSETRDDIGIATYIADNMDKVLLGYHCAVITPDSALVDSKYLNAYMHSNIVHKYFENNASGSGQRYTLSYNALLNIPVLLPDLESQKEMGQIFSNIDRKIALNRQINDNLRASRAQSQTQFELCRGAAVNADISPNLLTLDRSLREARVRLAA